MSDVSRLAAHIQHTNVSPAATRDEIAGLCDEAAAFGFNGVMVQPCWISLCRTRLAGTNVRVCSAMAYPLGGSLTRSKVAEMRDLVSEGAQEVDFMANIGFLASGDVNAFHDEIAALVDTAGAVPLKIMLELGAMPDDLWQTAIGQAEKAGVAYVKNSSGWGLGGKASVETIGFMKRCVTRAKVKASGGIRSAEDADAILKAGAELIGTSAGPAIMEGRVGAGGY
ncbi:MAG: deoxyribose-phosphate aldolase [Roseitalea sp.]|nr:deoxyribose-phosphate aldolase [Roseitalea sp.]MBO6950444.1 deoxyribose-phosphate aldolase [Rhizobiaceae bacterium]MBO6591567.1 deoxyribose-phosphate aldolase [Roseitalea sp.]MBO6599422.1 deoxyribose-phosphate aldolase [Roseitalea sp.]MBO6612089.1 deoxyribose-phosphate aldolase [Roseitalea sp.]